jgi:hypothetical protein
MTTGNIAGKGINGTISPYPSNRFNGTGRVGKRAGIGKNSKRGVSRV